MSQGKKSAKMKKLFAVPKKKRTFALYEIVVENHTKSQLKTIRNRSWKSYETRFQ
jgi:hypothetical protein